LRVTLLGKNGQHLRETGCNYAVVRRRTATYKKFSDVPKLIHW